MSDSCLRSVTIHTDGSCWPNPGGPGGWAFVLIRQDGERVEHCGHIPAPTTNNRAELTAAIEALSYLLAPTSITLKSDSEYLVKGASEWMWKWHRRNWKGVKNVNLWRTIWQLCSVHNVIWEWVPAHQNKGTLNDRCDALADKMRLTV